MVTEQTTQELCRRHYSLAHTYYLKANGIPRASNDELNALRAEKREIEEELKRREESLKSPWIAVHQFTWTGDDGVEQKLTVESDYFASRPSKKYLSGEPTISERVSNTQRASGEFMKVHPKQYSHSCRFIRVKERTSWA